MVTKSSIPAKMKKAGTGKSVVKSPKTAQSTAKPAKAVLARSSSKTAKISTNAKVKPTAKAKPVKKSAAAKAAPKPKVVAKKAVKAAPKPKVGAKKVAKVAPKPKVVAKKAVKAVPKSKVVAEKVTKAVSKPKVAAKKAVAKVSTPAKAKPKTVPKSVVKSVKANKPTGVAAKSVKPKANTSVKQHKPVTPKKAAVIHHAPTMQASTTGLVEFKPYEVKKNEAYMNEKQKQHFREILQQMKRQLMADVDQTMEMMRDEEKNFSDVADIATHEEVSNLILRTRNREGKLLRKIEESLELIDNGDFGYCEACGVEIGIRRLEARPTATLCIDCKTLDEIREKQRGN